MLSVLIIILFLSSIGSFGYYGYSYIVYFMPQHNKWYNSLPNDAVVDLNIIDGVNELKRQLNRQNNTNTDNNFNKSKSDLKYLEASALGLPIACQDLCTYKDAPIKFKTGDEMIDRIKETLSSERNFIKASVNGRNVAEKRFLETETNLYQYYDNYMYDQGDPKRKYLKP